MKNIPHALLKLIDFREKPRQMIFAMLFADKKRTILPIKICDVRLIAVVLALHEFLAAALLSSRGE